MVTTNAYLTIAHELHHGITGTGDPSINASDTIKNANGFDFDGPQVSFQNQVAIDLGLNNSIRASYEGQFSASFGNTFGWSLGNQFTDGGHIDNMTYGMLVADDIDYTLKTDNANDLVFGLDGDDTICAGGGDDYVYGGLGNDTISGGAGDDYLFGEDGDNIMNGNDGNDVLVGTTGANTLYGGDGDDVIWARGDGSIVFGDDGDDTIVIGTSSTIACGGAGADTFRIESNGDAYSPMICIVDSDPLDQLIVNGYQLLGGPTTFIEREDTSTYSANLYGIGNLDSNGNIYYRYDDDPSIVWIELANGTMLEIDDFENGDLGLNVPVINWSTIWDGGQYVGPDLPDSNIAMNGLAWDFSSLAGRAATNANYGTSVLDHWYPV